MPTCRQSCGRRQRGDIKMHMVPPHGIIFELEPEKNCGRIRSSDGRELYFHRKNLPCGEFDRLKIGDEVSFVEEVGKQGLQASTVQLIGRHHW